MTTSIDFDALQASEGPKVTLLGNRDVGGGLVGSGFADFSSFSSLAVEVKAQRRSARSPSASLTVLVEHSDDGLSWVTAQTFTFVDDGEQSASVASPKAYLRGSASGVGGDWYLKSLTVSPSYLDASGGGGSMPDPFIVTGTDPDRETARIHAAVGQVQSIFECEIDDGAGGDHSLLSLGPPGGAGFQIGPNPANSTAVQFLDDGTVHFRDEDGDASLNYTPGNKTLDLDPQNGGIGVLQAAGKGFVRFQASEPPDGDLFNGAWIFYLDGNDLKAKAKISDVIVHATLGTFA